ncbi:MAG TPA: zinc dependent phospholipase C family protein [Desulfuromonadaceae bacterium]
MPGPYAHIALVNEVRDSGALDAVFPETPAASAALAEFFPYCELGAVSPDYPNLAPDAGRAGEWADAMHYRRTGAMITKGIELVRAHRGDGQGKMLAWLLGYAAHVVADVTIHPVVRCKVGDYAANRRQHRVCEMNQDAHVFRRMGVGEIGACGCLNQRVAECGDAGNGDLLDRDVAGLWSTMLREVHPELYGENHPDPREWHGGFGAMAAAGVEDGQHLFPLARVIASRNALSYPVHAETDPDFIDHLEVPRGGCLHYDAIFEKAVGHTREVWSTVARGVLADDAAYRSFFGEWDLDTGLDENGRLVFWG